MKSVTEIRESLPRDKQMYDLVGNPVAFFIARPLSFYLTPSCIALGVTANQASWAATIVAIATAVTATMTRNPALVPMLVLLWLVIDCVDGNIARATKTGSRYGEYLDALSGYLLSALLPVCLVYGQSAPIAFLGGVAGVFALLSRLLLNKSLVLSGNSRNSSGDTGSGLMVAFVLSVYNLSGLGLAVLAAALYLQNIAIYIVSQTALGLCATFAAVLRANRQLAQ